MKKTKLLELDKLYHRFKKAAKEMAGYPLCQSFDYSKLFHFLEFHINNLGDPFLKSWHYKINTLKIEREVIDQFAELFNAPKNSYWGYVTNGGTEGNLYGLYIARELYPSGIVFFSDQTHYSVPKNLKLLRMSHIKVQSDESGEIDYNDLSKLLANCKETPIIFANIGTTMKGAVDNIQKIKVILTKLKIKKYYIHCDAAFFGMILPFIPELDSDHFDFRAGIDSIAISGHKVIGTPFPCGVVIIKKQNQHLTGSHIEYTGCQDNTITGSRNGLSPLFLWHELNCAKEKKFEILIHDCIKKAGYAVQKFNELGIKAWRNKNSVIVVFPRPSEKMIRKWQLAVENEISHLIILPHLTKSTLDKFIHEIYLDLNKTGKDRK